MHFHDTLIELAPRQPTRYISRARTVLAIGPDGFISGGQEQGLWCFQTRMLSRYRWLVNGKVPELTAGSNVEQHSWRGYYIAIPQNYKETGAQDDNAAQQTIELKLTRVVGYGFCEDAQITNYTQIATVVHLELELDSDFADPDEAQSGKRKQKGSLKHSWSKTVEGFWSLNFDYHAEHAFNQQGNKGLAHMHRAIKGVVQTKDGCAEPDYAAGKIRFTIDLGPHESWRVRLIWSIAIENEWAPPVCNAEAPGTDEAWDDEQRRFLSVSTSFSPAETSNDLTQIVLKTLDRSKRDLFALRLFDLDQADHAWAMAAGVPTYVAFFGRDSLVASLESSLLSTELMQGSAQTLVKYQATQTNPWRDEQPGRMVHELHTNPLSVLNFNPHACYYGDVNASIRFPMIVAALWHWTGDKDLVRPLVEPALKTLHWADENANSADGFYRYKTYSKQGEKNQGWKDSSDAIVYEDGTQVPDPLGTCEMQAFVYASKIHFSELLYWLDDAQTAKKLYREAEELKKRFNEKFWLADEQFFAMGIDSQGRLIRSIASDPGHCLATGIIDESLAPAVASRLMQDDLFSGWGVRSLSANHPAYNPYAYHRGTVWPVENGLFVLAFARYGFHQDANRLAKALFESASLFQYCRLPELFAGHPRDDHHPFPGMYPYANSPQAWSASAPFSAMQGLLGLYPYAPLKVLLLDPWLPEWLPSIRVEKLRVGTAVTTIRFQRNASGQTDYYVEDLQGDLHVLRQPGLFSLTSNYGGRVSDTITSLIPGH